MRTDSAAVSEQLVKGAERESKLRLSVVLPTYNEKDNVGPLTQELLNILRSERCESYTPFEILFVDDGSTDGTKGRLRTLVSRFEPVASLLLRRNFGQSAALAAGIDYASGDVIVTMDADRQNDPSDIPRLLREYEKGYDCVSGWRQERDDSLSKRIPSRIQSKLAKLTGPSIHDFGCTLKVYSADSIQDIDIYGEGHRYIPAKLYNRGYDITELPVNHRPRERGDTKYGWRRLVKGFVDLVFHLFWNRYSTRPLHIFGGIGLMCTILGIAIGFHALFIKYALGIPLTPRLPRLVFLTALILFGVQLLVFGVLAEMLARFYYRDRRPYRVEELVDDES